MRKRWNSSSGSSSSTVDTRAAREFGVGGTVDTDVEDGGVKFRHTLRAFLTAPPEAGGSVWNKLNRKP